MAFASDYIVLLSWLLGAVAAVTVVVPCCSTATVASALRNTSVNVVALTSGATYTGHCDFTFGGATRAVTLLGNGATVNCNGSGYALRLDYETSSDVIVGPLTIIGSTIIGVLSNNSNTAIHDVIFQGLRGGVVQINGNLHLQDVSFKDTIPSAMDGSVLDVTGGQTTLTNVTATNNSLTYLNSNDNKWKSSAIISATDSNVDFRQSTLLESGALFLGICSNLTFADTYVELVTPVIALNADGLNSGNDIGVTFLRSTIAWENIFPASGQVCLVCQGSQTYQTLMCLRGGLSFTVVSTNISVVQPLGLGPGSLIAGLGGEVFISHSKLHVDGFSSVVDGSHAVTLVDSTVSQISQQSPFLFSGDASLYTSNTTFARCTQIADTSLVSMTNSTVVHSAGGTYSNDIATCGGAIICASRVYISGVSFCNNSVDAYLLRAYSASFIYDYSAFALEISDSTFIGNTIGSGMLMALLAASNTISHTTFRDNMVGALTSLIDVEQQLYSSTAPGTMLLSLTDVNFYNNTAGSYIYMRRIYVSADCIVGGNVHYASCGPTFPAFADVYPTALSLNRVSFCGGSSEQYAMSVHDECNIPIVSGSHFVTICPLIRGTVYATDVLFDVFNAGGGFIDAADGYLVNVLTTNSTFGNAFQLRHMLARNMSFVSVTGVYITFGWVNSLQDVDCPGIGCRNYDRVDIFEGFSVINSSLGAALRVNVASFSDITFRGNRPNPAVASIQCAYNTATPTTTGVLLFICGNCCGGTDAYHFTDIVAAENVANGALVVQADGTLTTQTYTNITFMRNQICGSPNSMVLANVGVTVFLNKSIIADLNGQLVVVTNSNDLTLVCDTLHVIGLLNMASAFSANSVVVTMFNVTFESARAATAPIFANANLQRIANLTLSSLLFTSSAMAFRGVDRINPISVRGIVMKDTICPGVCMSVTNGGVTMEDTLIDGVEGMTIQLSQVSTTTTLTRMTVMNSINRVESLVFIDSAVGTVANDIAFFNNTGSAVVNHEGIFRVNGDLTVTNLNSAANTEPIYVVGGLTLTSGTFTGNTGSVYGAALRTRQATLSGCTFVGNTAGDNGALYASSFGGRLKVSESTFRDNSCGNQGGALSVAPNNELTLCNVGVVSNSAVTGGGIYVGQGGKCKFDALVLSLNVATTDGGGMYLGMPGNLGGTIANSFINSNSALNGVGGGIVTTVRNEGGVLSFQNVTISNNVALHGGGAHIDGMVAFVNVTVSHNTAVGGASSTLSAGGGLYLGIAANMQISTNLNVTFNIAELGGGMYCDGCRMELRNSGFVSNVVTGAGAAYYCSQSNTRPQSVLLNTSYPNTISDNMGGSVFQAVCDTCGCCRLPGTIVSLADGCIPAVGRACVFQCAAGYTANGDSTHGGLLYCAQQPTVSDSGLSTTPCLGIPCEGDPPAVPNASFEPVPNAKTPDFTRYVCDAANGYALRPLGNATGATPVDNGLVRCIGPNWVSAEAVECAKQYCPIATNTYSDGVTNCDGSGRLAAGASCLGTCNSGYYGRTVKAACMVDATGDQGIVSIGHLDCTACGSGTWRAADFNSESCTSCGPNSVTLVAAATDPSMCGCLANFVINATNMCETCPKGAKCIGGRNPAVSAPGYYPTNDTNGQEIYLACRPAIACAGDNICSEGYQGYLCGDCVENYHRFSGKCLPCPEVNSWRVTIGIIGGLIACLLLMFATKPTQESERTVGFGSLTVGLSFVQLVATFATINVQWPHASAGMYDTFSTANLNVEIVNPECSVKANYYEKFQTTLLTPFIIAALFGVAWLIGSLVIWLRQGRPKVATIRLRLELLAESALSGYFFFLSLAYLMLARASFSIFACPKLADGRRTLTDDPATECTGDVWSRNAVFGVFGIVVYVFGIPVALHASYALVKRKYGHRVAGGTYLSNFLVKTYKPRFWFWEVVSMARKLAIVIIALFAVQDPTVQLVLSCAVFFASAVLTLVFKPFEWPKHNFVEVVTQLGCIIVLFCGAVAVNQTGATKPSVAETTALDAVIIASVVLALLGVLLCFMFELGITIYIMKLFKSLFPKKPAPLVIAADNTHHPIAIVSVNSELVTVAADGALTHRNPSTLVSVAEYPTGLADVTHAAALGDFIVVAAGTHLSVQHPTGVEVWSMKTLPAAVTALASNADGLVLGLASGHVIVWRKNTTAKILAAPSSIDTGVLETPVPATKAVTEAGLVGYSAQVSIEVGSEPLVGVAIELDFVYSLAARTVKKWNSQSGACLRKWEINEVPEVTCLAVKGSSIAVGGSNGRVVLIQKHGVAREVLAGHRAAISSLACARDYLISAGRDGKVICWNLTTGRYRQSMPDNNDSVVLVLANEGATHIFWALRSGEIRTYPLHAAWDVVNVEYLLWKAQQAKCKRCKLPRALFGGDGFEEHLAAEKEMMHSYAKAEDGSRPGVYDELELLVQGTNWNELDVDDANHVSSLLGNAASDQRS